MVDTSVRYLSAKEVATFLNVTEQHIFNLINRHRIAGVRVGRSIRIHPNELEKFLSKNDTRRA